MPGGVFIFKEDSLVNPFPNDSFRVLWYMKSKNFVIMRSGLVPLKEGFLY